MKLLQRLLHELFNFRTQESVCSACSYYDDEVIDDENAFVSIEKPDRGWILNYMTKTFGK